MCVHHLSKCSQCQTAVRYFHKEMREAARKNHDLEDRVSDLQIRIAELESEYARIFKENQNKNQRVTNLTKRNITLKRQNYRWEEKFKQDMARLSGLQDKLAKALKKNNSSKEPVRRPQRRIRKTGRK